MTLQLPDSIIDMHTHMFNADYLPLRGIFRSRGVPSPLNGWLARLAWALTKTHKFPQIVPKPLKLLEKSRTAGQKQMFAKDDHDHGHGHDPKVLERYIEVLSDEGSQLFLYSQAKVAPTLQKADDGPPREDIHDEIRALFGEIHKEFGDEESSADLERNDHDTLEILNATEKSKLKIWGRGLRRMLRRFLKKAISFVEKAVDFIDFVWNMTKTEKQLLKRLQNYYKTRNIPCVMTHYMMDMQFPFQLGPGGVKDGQVKIDFYRDSEERPSQLTQMQRLADQSSGTLIGFSAFDPVRFLLSGSSDRDITAYLDKARAAGMVGFKFYPPLGFRPADNDITGMEFVVDKFLDYCVEHDIPVFTHCTPEGFEISPSDESGLNADPRYWRKALEKNSVRRNLRLCLGHAGGGVYKLKSGYVSHGWISDGPSQWEREDNYAKHVVDLCREFPNVYCELANIETILDSSAHRHNLRKNLLARLVGEAHVGTYSLRDKIMYGTDWHMVGMVNDIIDYFDILLEIFSDDKLIELLPNFFRDNALSYLNQNGFLAKARENFPSDFKFPVQPLV